VAGQVGFVKSHIASSEATAWVNAAFNAALAIGTAGAGVVIDATSPSTALGAFAVAAALLIAAAGTRPAATREAARLP
jgi:predicted MFS family arabinose efflux permease